MLHVLKELSGRHTLFALNYFTSRFIAVMAGLINPAERMKMQPDSPRTQEVNKKL